MSKQSFDKAFQNPLLRKLDKEARKSVERQRGQLLILADTKDLAIVIEMVIPGVALKDSDLRAALKAGQEHAKKLHNNFKRRNKRRYNAIVSKLPDIRLPHKLGTDMFVVSSFSRSIDTIKKTMLSTLQGRGVFTETQQKDVSRNLHKGHGARGTAVSQVQIAASTADLNPATKKLLLHNLGVAHSKGDLTKIEYREISSLITRGEQIVTKAGKLKADYVSVISFQVGEDNIADSITEKALKKVYRDFIKGLSPDLVDMEGSSSLKQKAEKVVVDQFRNKSGIKVTSKSGNYKLKTKVSSTSRPKKKKGVVGITKGTPRKAKTRTKAVASYPLALMTMLNRDLPRVVQKNMGEPGLVNRSGRFASSVRVTEVVQTPKGFPSIGYTYMREPYQVFETGSTGNWSSKERDPRNLIDKSIREIAASMAIGRFYTRRV